MSGGLRVFRGSAAPVYVLASIALFFPGLFRGQIPVFRDLLVLMIPLRWSARDAVRSGSLPLWTNDLFFGAPVLADYQSAVLYPPSALLYALPFATGFSVFLAFHVALAGWGMAHYVEHRCGRSRGPAILAGLVFSLGGFLTSLISLTNQLVVAAWMPWALAAAERLAASGGRRHFLLLTLIITLQALGGGPETLLLTIALIGASLVRSLLRRSATWIRCFAVLASLLFAAALTAAQLLPTAEYALQTDRTAGLAYELVTAESIAPRSLLQLVVPHTFEAGAASFLPEGTIPLFWSLYVGVVPLALAATAFTFRPLGFWPLVFGVALLLSFGGHTPLFSALHHFAPQIVGAFRFPGKFFLLCHFALAVSSAEGLERALSERRAANATRNLLLAIGAFCAAIAVLGSVAPESLLRGFGYILPPELGSLAKALLAARLGLVATRGALLSSAAVMLLWLFGRNAITVRWLLLTMGTLTAVDLFSIHQPSLVFADWESLLRAGATRAEVSGQGERWFHYCVNSPRCLPEGAPGLGPWNGFLRPGESVEGQARALWTALVPNAPMVYGLGAVAGSDGFSTRAQQDFFRTLALLPRERAVHLLASLGVSHLVGREPLDSLAELVDAHEDPDASTWEYSLSERAPHAYLAERVLVAPGTASALEELAEPTFRPGRDAILTVSSGPSFGTELGGKILKVSSAPDAIRAEVALPADGLWVVCDTWFPGWEAVVDGSVAEVLRVNGIHRGVRVPAGSHRVEMRYWPRSFHWGLAVSAAAIVSLLIVAFAADGEGKT
jgi:hypothetical protein